MRGHSYWFFRSATLYVIVGMFPGITLATLDRGETLAIAGSLLTLASMPVFAWTVIRAGFASRSLPRTGVPHQKMNGSCPFRSSSSI